MNVFSRVPRRTWVGAGIAGAVVLAGAGVLTAVANADGSGTAAVAPVEVPANPNPNGLAAGPSAPAASASPEGTAPAPAPQDTADIGPRAALDTALRHAGLDRSLATVVATARTSLDTDDGRSVYEVEFFHDATEYDYEIDARTGAVVAFDHDIEGFDLGHGEREARPGTAHPGTDGLITTDQATAIVLDRVPGATASDVRIVLDHDDGRVVYEGEVVVDGTEHEFELDATNGAVLSWESEPLRD